MGFSNGSGTQAADRAKVPSTTELLAELAELKRQLASATAITFKIGEKGGIMVLGLQRFPVTLYAEQWERILAAADELKGFIAANRKNLKWKHQAAE